MTQRMITCGTKRAGQYRVEDTVEGMKQAYREADGAAPKNE
jgi:hypothetical protein